MRSLKNKKPCYRGVIARSPGSAKSQFFPKSVLLNNTKMKIINSATSFGGLNFVLEEFERIGLGRYIIFEFVYIVHLHGSAIFYGTSGRAGENEMIKPYVMKKILILFCFVSFWNPAYNQVIKGTILDKDTKYPIDFAAVYFNGTFAGTNTDKNGDFELDISKYESMPLTISALGYFSVTIDKLSTDQKLTVYLTPKVFELDEMIISAKSNPEERKKNLQFFRRALLGVTLNSARCRILNEEDVYFRYNAQKDTLKAFASKPLLIDNKELGYKVTYYLDNLRYCKSSGNLYREGYILFKEDTTARELRKRIFNITRRRAYLGSRMHFIRALWENRLNSEGFTVTDSTGLEPDYNNYVFNPDSVNDSNPVKYLKYPGNLYVKYKGKESYISFLKDHACIQKNGNCDLGIAWHGKMARQGLADEVPLDYILSPN
jgi:hypothetical protein